ncbi:MAG TPA: lysozyme inhibitor LprI family protein [Stellaceae bacterium]|nr:lysozyme inhibitor LprI family protein [Stellaceae bacterium]
MTSRIALFLALLSALWAEDAAAQPSFDCTKATTATEKAICASPELAAADTAMNKAFAALAKSIAPDQQAALHRDQIDWIKSRDSACSERKDEALAACLLGETDKRRHLLLGEGGSGAAGAPPLLPTYFREVRPKLYEITLAYPQFTPPAGANFNKAVREPIFGKNALAEYRQNAPNKFNGSSNFYQATYDIPYLSPTLASVALQFASYAGGAHPNNWRVGLLWDIPADKAVTPEDILADPAKAVPAISALCKAIGEREDWGLFSDADFAAVVGDLNSWAVDKDGVTIMFDPYSVAPYVSGPHDCRLSYAELKDWLKPGGLLPPQ